MAPVFSHFSRIYMYIVHVYIHDKVSDTRESKSQGGYVEIATQDTLKSGHLHVTLFQGVLMEAVKCFSRHLSIVGFHCMYMYSTRQKK